MLALSSVPISIQSVNLIQLLTCAAMMASSIFIPLIAEGYGAVPGTIGLLVGAYNLFFLLSSYLFGLFCDKYGSKYILRLGILFAAIVFFLQIFAYDLQSLFVLRSLAGLGIGIFPSALAVYAFSTQKGKMGKFTGFGSLGWAMGAIFAGLITNNQAIFVMSSISLFIAFWVSVQMTGNPHQPKEIKLIPFRLFQKNIRIYVPYFFRALGAQAVWAIFPLYLVYAGADKFWVGIAYFVNAGSQFFIMQYIEKFKNLYLFNIGLLLSAATFAGYAIFPHLTIVIVLQFLLALSFSTLQVGGVQELLEKNMEQTMSMSLFNSIINFTAVIGPFLAGYVAQFFGYEGVMWAAAALTFIGLISFTTVLE